MVSKVLILSKYLRSQFGGMMVLNVIIQIDCPFQLNGLHSFIQNKTRTAYYNSRIEHFVFDTLNPIIIIMRRSRPRTHSLAKHFLLMR